MSCCTKTGRTRLLECLDAIHACRNAPAHEVHVYHLAKDSDVKDDIGLDAYWTTNKETRTVIRAILLLEKLFKNQDVTLQRKQELLAAAQLNNGVAHLRHRLNNLLDEPRQGPGFFMRGGAAPPLNRRPADWVPAGPDGDQFVFHLNACKFAIGPRNPRTQAVMDNFPPKNMNGHSALAWELVRHFGIDGGVWTLASQTFTGTSGKCMTGGVTFREMLAGTVDSFKPILTLNDQTGHYYQNYSGQTERALFEYLRTVDPGIRFFHVGHCPWDADKRCGGGAYHLVKDNPPPYPLAG